jgi:mono/diheme cytochrome c family protein
MSGKVFLAISGATVITVAAVAAAVLQATGAPSDTASWRVAVRARAAVRSPLRQSPAAAVGHAVATRAVLDRYCVTCHNQRVKTANLTLDTTDAGDVGAQAEIWEKVVAKVRGGSMPPAGRPRPDEATTAEFVRGIEAELDRAAVAHPNPGRTVVHRLNRAEYANAIRDLFGLEIDPGALLPADSSGFGFDNIADVLGVSSSLLERYLSAARIVAKFAVGDPEIRPAVQIYKAAKNERQEDRISEDAPFGTRGGIAFHYYAPVDGDYGFKVRILRTVGDQDYIRGLHRLSEAEVRIDGERVMQFTVGGQLGCPVQGLAGSDCFTLLNGPMPTIDKDEPDALVFRLPLAAGDHVVTAAFSGETLELEGVKPRYPTSHYTFQNEIEGYAFIDTVEVDGPYNPKRPSDRSASRKHIFVCDPSGEPGEKACARTILARLARRAYRRPVAQHDVETLLQFFDERHEATSSFDAGIEAAIVRILVSPQFLFRAERDPATATPGQPYKISDIELASRLSFFLWSTTPDDELLTTAERRTLSNPATLTQQVKRMLKDARSSALSTNFAGQWLLLRNLQGVMPDTHEFPDFDDELRAAARRETELFFDGQIREDRGAPELLRADYTYLNERLARHYGIPNVYGSHFRRVAIADERRRGLLGQASILTVTSYPNRTSPVLRGKWVLENILGSPPPAPPPDAPALEEQPSAKDMSMRERMQQHRKNPVCASCHARIDPIGFAMENFDGVGSWRDRQGATAIDTSGSLDGRAFNGVIELRQLLRSHEREFVTTVTKKLLTYALGRGVEYYDMPAVRKIVGDAENDGYRWSSILLGIVNSTPFRMRRSES